MSTVRSAAVPPARPDPVGEDELWVLSFYRTSEISGALFFGRLARSLRPGPIQQDMTRHFADEAQHARYWTACIEDVGATAHKIDAAYQDQYLAAAGMPSNLMEILAITSVFERRVVRQYAQHLRLPRLHPAVAGTLAQIMDDEKWHISWVRDALRDLEPAYGKDHIDATVARMVAADREVYAATIREHQQRLGFLRTTREQVPSTGCPTRLEAEHDKREGG